MPIFLSETKSVEPTAEDRAHEIASTFGLWEESPLVAAITAAITEHAAGVEGRLKEAEAERDTAKRLRKEEEQVRIEQEADFLAAVKNLRLQVTAAEARADAAMSILADMHGDEGCQFKGAQDVGCLACLAQAALSGQEREEEVELATISKQIRGDGVQFCNLDEKCYRAIGHSGECWRLDVKPDAQENEEDAA